LRQAKKVRAKKIRRWTHVTQITYWSGTIETRARDFAAPVSIRRSFREGGAAPIPNIKQQE
jgi:hypothetical protein